MMKAWLFEKIGEPMKLVDLPNPKAKPGWVVLNVEAAGMCHSDIAMTDGTGTHWLSQLPMVLGHEVAGTIAEIGEGVTGFKVGDRVGVSGSAEDDENVANNGSILGDSIPGIHVNGGYAEQTMVRASRLIPIPDEVSFEQAAVGTDAITTAYQAVMSSGKVKSGDVVGIIGLGGLGMNGLRIAAVSGASVYGVDLNEDLFEEAMKNGASGCFKDIRELRTVKPNVIIDFAGMGTTTSEAVKAVDVNGRVVVVGLGKLEAIIDTQVLIRRRIQLKGSLGGTHKDLRQVYQLLAKGLINPTLTEVPFNELNYYLEQFREGKTRGRIFTRPNC